tara:strand:+ start:12373 stop:12720 length:348 start_codon:yes stop_codon:yes gene_type:complete
MSRLSPQELANEFSNFVNGSSDEKNQEFVNHFCNQHRTLQQSMFGVMMQVLEKVGHESYRTDGRNQSSHETGKTLLKGYKTQMKKELMESDPNFWTEERAIDQANRCKPSSLPLI